MTKNLLGTIRLTVKNKSDKARRSFTAFRMTLRADVGIGPYKIIHIIILKPRTVLYGVLCLFVFIYDYMFTLFIIMALSAKTFIHTYHCTNSIRSAGISIPMDSAISPFIT